MNTNQSKRKICKYALYQVKVAIFKVWALLKLCENYCRKSQLFNGGNDLKLRKASKEKGQ